MDRSDATGPTSALPSPPSGLSRWLVMCKCGWGVIVDDPVFIPNWTKKHLAPHSWRVTAPLHEVVAGCEMGAQRTPTRGLLTTRPRR